MTRLLFNCDDFGKTHGVNTAVLKAYCEGVLRSASLMVTGDAFLEAVEAGKRDATPAIRMNLLDIYKKNQNEIKKIAEIYKDKTNSLFLGRGVNFPIALEGALKLKEVSYLHAEGYPAAEMKHGPIALIDKNMPVLFIATKDNYTYKKVLGNIHEVKARNGIVIAIATEGDEEVNKLADYAIYIPKTLYILSSILTAVPLQLLAYYVAVDRGLDPDKPRNLSKSVVVE